jgi:BirA family biotin operon repressor/biotin-[acetyl-CoA-carboxylase] ligase
LSPRGASVLCSVLLVYPEDAARKDAGRLTMVAAVAACEAIGKSTEVRPAIKWPNDLRISGKKAGGILIESRALGGNRRAYVLGFGINCLQHAGHFPLELRNQATSLELAASHPIDRGAVARALLMELDEWLGRPKATRAEHAHAAWLSFAEPIGQRVSLRYQGTEYSGRTVSVDPLGGLTLQLDDGRPMWFDPMLTSVV